MPSLVFVTQVIDPDDPVLGFVVPQLRALADRCSWLGVVANEVRTAPPELAGVEIASMGKELGHGKVRRTARYLALLRDWTAAHHVDAILLHMCPPYVNTAAPVAMPRSIPMLLWYTHPTQTPSLRLATHLATRILTADSRSFPITGDKVMPIGQAIDVDRFRPVPLPRTAGVRLAAIGRPSPLKRYDVAIRAVHQCRQAGLDVRLRIIGSPATEVERREDGELRALISDLGLASEVTIEPGRPQAELIPVLADVHAVVNTTVGGSADKVVYEAMAVGRPVLVSSPAFRALVHDLPVRLDYPEGDDTALAERLAELRKAPHAALEETGHEVRRRVVAEHSLTHWAEAVVDIVAGLSTIERRGRRAPWSRSES